jgi:hypothetical protein
VIKEYGIQNTSQSIKRRKFGYLSNRNEHGRPYLILSEISQHRKKNTHSYMESKKKSRMQRSREQNGGYQRHVAGKEHKEVVTCSYTGRISFRNLPHSVVTIVNNNVLHVSVLLKEWILNASTTNPNYLLFIIIFVIYYVK